MKNFYNTLKAISIFMIAFFFFNTVLVNASYAERNPGNDTEFSQPPGDFGQAVDLTHEEPILGRIVGGQTANIASYPWQVAIMTSSNSQFCGGSIINEYWIVTAAHCLGHYSNIRIRAGVTDKRSTAGQDRIVAEEIPHPQYHASTHRNDIALLRLSSPLDLTGNNAKAIPIVTAGHADIGIQDPGVAAIITGWGATSEGGSASNTLMVAEVPVVSNADAMNPGYYNQGQITDDMICAGYMGQGGIDACQGDSGGPFVVPADDSPVGYRLAGATSWGYGCARPYYPGVYARVSHFQPWIQQQTGLTWEGPGAGGVANPSNLSANGVSQSQINLSWQRNSSNNGVIVAWSSSGSFGTPNNGTTYNAGSSIPGGGQVVYRGTNTSYQHTGLSASTTYFYKVWSYDGSNQYSSGITANANTQCGIISSLPYNEGFSGTSTPSCWSVIDNRDNGQVWQFGTINNGLSGASGNYAYLNSDGYGSGNTQNADLVSPTFDFSGYSSVTLSFKHYFRQYQTSSSATLSYSLDNGNTWTQIQQWTATSANPATFNQQIQAVAGKNNVRFKWNYTGTWGYYWCIDDIQISGSQQAQQYTLTMAANGSGSVSPLPGSHAYNEGASVSIYASPAPGNVFDKWVINGSNYTSASLQFTMNANVSATAYFVPEASTCDPVTTLSEGFSSTVLPDCWEIVDHQGNGQVWQFGTINNGLSGASGNYAYLNSDAYGNGNSQNTDLISPTLDLSGYSAVNVSFKHYFRQYQTSSSATLSYSTNNGATWTQVQQWTATSANPATFNAEIPGVAGQSQVKFKWNYTGSWGYYWCMDDIEITGSSAPQQYTLTMATSGSGSTSPAIGTHTYDAGASVSISATPASGHQFVKWVVNGADYTSQTLNLTMNEDVNATAHFAPVQYNLTVAKDGSGSTSPAVGTHTYNAGASVTLNATPASGNNFVKWVINGSDNTNQSVNITMNSNFTATAYFAEDTQYALTVSINGSGSTTPAPGTYYYNEGAQASIIATPASGHDFVKWVINGTDYPATNYNITMNTNLTAVAHFAPQGCAAYTLPFFEGFNNTSLPQCWEIVDHQGNGQVWQFGTGGAMQGASGNYAFLNSDGYGSGNSQNADLITPNLDLSDYSSVTVSFKHYFRQYQTSSTARFFYSTNNGATWTQVQEWTATTANPTTFEMDIAAVAGQSQVKFKWNYTGSWGYYWSIDDVQITGISGDVCAFSLPFSENFNSSTAVPDCWDVIDNQGNGQVWTFGTVNGGLSGTSGNYALLNSDGYGNNNTQNSDLITPTINTSGFSNVNVTFKHYFRQWNDVSTARFSYSTDNGATWSQVQQWTATTANPATFNMNIPAVANKSQVKFKWNYTGSWGYYWCVDDLVISGSSKAGEESQLMAGFDVAKVSIYPNPASNKVNISLSGLDSQTEIHLVNMHGQVLKTLVVSESELMQDQELIVNEFTPGVYFIRIVSGEFVETKQLIIK